MKLSELSLQDLGYLIKYFFDKMCDIKSFKDDSDREAYKELERKKQLLVKERNSRIEKIYFSDPEIKSEIV